MGVGIGYGGRESQLEKKGGGWDGMGWVCVLEVWVVWFTGLWTRIVELCVVWFTGLFGCWVGVFGEEGGRGVFMDGEG